MGEALSRAIQQRRRQGGLAVIAEVKGRRADGIDLLRGRSPAEIARVYQSAGATAISVVTSSIFGGNLSMLAEVSAANLGLPILRKDLIRTEKSIEISKRLGASAVLLVLPLLGLERLLALVQAARAESLEPFVEVATRQEIEELRQVYDGVIAINNSDIKTNEVEGADISRSVALIDRRDPRLWISASRIHGPDDVGSLAAAGFDGILIGTHLLLADDVEMETNRIVAAARSAGRPGPSRPVIKICGITSEVEVEHVASCGVDFFGLVVHVPSPWTITRQRAKQLAARGSGQLRATLIARPDHPDKLAELVRETGVTAIQLGAMTLPKHVQQLRSAFHPESLCIMQELSYRQGRFWKEEQVDEYLAAGADFILLDQIKRTDTNDESARVTIPPGDLAGFRDGHVGKPILVAGGVSAENASALMAASGAVGIDVCSSVRRDGAIQRELVVKLTKQFPRGSGNDS